MSIFDAGFIVWGYLAFYVAITVAYLVWARAKNRREASRRDQHEHQSANRPSGRDDA